MRSLRVGVAIALAVIVGTALSPGTAAAHGDVVLVDRTVEIAPRAEQRFGGELHYHRLVGIVSSDADVRVRFARAADGASAVDEAPGREVRLNRLIRCCDDRGWTPYTLIIENATDRVARVRADVRLVHDDLAVMAYQAEAGTRESVVIIGGIWLGLLWAVRRKAGRPLRPTAIAFAVLCAVVIALAAYGSGRYGGSAPEALVAALGEVPVLPANPIVSRAALLLLVAGIAWSWVLARWAASATGRGHALMGAALFASVVATAIAMSTAYGEPGMPAAFTLAASLPVALSIARRYRGAARRPYPSPGSGATSR